MDDLRSRLASTERNQSDLARTITELVGSLGETQHDVSRLLTDAAVNVERENARDEWRGRTEKKLDGIYKLGWWVLASAIAVERFDCGAVDWAGRREA